MRLAELENERYCHVAAHAQCNVLKLCDLADCMNLISEPLLCKISFYPIPLEMALDLGFCPDFD